MYVASCGFIHSVGKRRKAMEVTVKDGQTLADIAVQHDTAATRRREGEPCDEKLLQGTRGEPGDGKGREQRKATDFR